MKQVTVTHSNKSPEEVVKDIYLSLLKQGNKLNDIDTMDIVYYFDLMEYESENKQGKTYIDNVF